jgi:uncharacterized membrane protein YraQ (UPF0718 family)
MSLKTRFFISLVIIILLDWADVYFIGTHQNTNLPNLSKQIIHFITLLITYFIGYYNVKYYKEKWMLTLWTLIYAIFGVILIITSLLGYIKGGLVPEYYLNLILGLRSILSGPLLLMIFYVFQISSFDGVKKKVQ